MNITASLQIKNNIYQVVLNYKDINGKRKQKWFSTGLSQKGNNKRLANQKMQEILADFKESLNNESTNNSTDKLLTAYLQEWLLSIKNTIEENTYDSYKVIVNKICDYFEDKQLLLKDLKPVHIQEFYTTLYEKKLTGNTVLHYHNVIRKSLQTALKLDLILSNPADKIERPKKEQYIGTFYSQAELNTLFSLIKDDPLKIVIYLASFYGLRRSEVLGLKWSAIDFLNKKIMINHVIIENPENMSQLIKKDQTKNSSSYRTLPLVETIERALVNQAKWQQDNRILLGEDYILKDSEYVFTMEDGRLMKPQYVTHRLSKLIKKNGLKKIRFHDLRHSNASIMLDSGQNMKSIQEWLGHASYSTTANLYTHLTAGVKERAAEALENAFGFKE